jgi:hypothetical protein
MPGIPKKLKEQIEIIITDDSIGCFFTEDQFDYICDIVNKLLIRRSKDPQTVDFYDFVLTNPQFSVLMKRFRNAFKTQTKEDPANVRDIALEWAREIQNQQQGKRDN